MTWLTQLLAPVRDLLIGAVVGAVVMGALTLTCGDKQMRELRAVSDSIARQSAKNTAFEKLRSDSLQRDVDSLKGTEVIVIQAVEQDTVAANEAERSLAQARTVRDTNVALRLENENLRRANTGLWTALALVNQERDIEHARGDSLLNALQTANANIQVLNARVQKTRPAPTWLRVGAEVAKLGGAVYAGYQLGKHS